MVCLQQTSLVMLLSVQITFRWLVFRFVYSLLLSSVLLTYRDVLLLDIKAYRIIDNVSLQTLVTQIVYYMLIKHFR